MSLSAYFRLQELIETSQDTHQDLRNARDVGPYRTLVVTVQRPKAATGGTLELWTAPVNELDAYTNTAVSVSVGATGPVTVVIENPSRWLIWKTAQMNGAAAFVVDVVGRA